MPLWELALPTALDIGLLLVLWQVAKRIVKGLSVKGQQVCTLCLSILGKSKEMHATLGARAVHSAGDRPAAGAVAGCQARGEGPVCQWPVGERRIS